MCTTTNGNEVDQTWTEFIASDIGSSAIATSDVSSSTSLSSAYSEECTYTEPYYSLVVCVSGQMKVVFYKDEYCSEDASIVYTFDECVELEYDDLGTSAALSCRFDYDTCGAGSDTFSSTDPDIGNGYCDSTLNSEDCNYDGGKSSNFKKETPVKGYIKQRKTARLHALDRSDESRTNFTVPTIRIVRISMDNHVYIVRITEV